MAWFRLISWAITGLIALTFLPPRLQADESLGEKIRNFFVTPTPTPAHHHRRKATPTPSPSPKKKTKPKHKASPTASPTPSPSPSPSPENTASPSPMPKTKVASLSPNEIGKFDENPEPVRKLLTDALELTKRHLDYSYGSADPTNGGMDCSGFIYYVLRENGIKDVPRSASEQYVWVRKAGNFRAVLSRDIDSFELDELRPGDLLFWIGTYDVEHDPPVTHTMIYLGKEKATGKPIMVGASDGRTYQGEQQFGVSVFDFKTARPKAAGTAERQPRFVGYAKIPGLGEKEP
jgi:cell wall-associated NlpC family hydrolase